MSLAASGPLDVFAHEQPSQLPAFAGCCRFGLGSVLGLLVRTQKKNVKLFARKSCIPDVPGPSKFASRPAKKQRLLWRACWPSLMLALASCADSSSSQASSSGSATVEEKPLSNVTILIIRHAEKPDNGPGLSSAGEARATAYVRYFRDLRLDSGPVQLDYLVAAEDSEHSQRSRLTLEPLSQALGLKPDLRFQSRRPQDLARELRTHAHGRTILICWHHGEIPELLRELGASPESLLPGGQWPARAFGWMLCLRYDEQGRLIPNQSRRLKEHLMPGD